MNRPLIFITNDDGVDSKGFAALLEVARKFGKVIGVAPENSQSGMSHAITMTRPLRLRHVIDSPDAQVYACDGTPVDCVKIAFDYLWADNKPDLALSGINHGSNSSVSVIYSGTMGAAIEASFYDIPSIGFSLISHLHDADFEASKHFATQIIKDIIESEVKTPLCLNVNIPIGDIAQIKGIKVCRQSMGYYHENFMPRKDPHGNDYFWLTGDLINLEPEATDNDEAALERMYVSVVPVQVDMTNHAQIDVLKEIIK